jgi:hypothetical protein
MKRNINSIPARLYRDFYAFEGADEMPKSLCSYFWKLMGMWLVIVPLSLFSIAGFIIEICEYFQRKLNKKSIRFPIYSSKDRVLGSLAIYAFLLLIWCIGVGIVGIFTPLSYHGLFGVTHTLGITVDIIIAIALIFWFFGGGPFNIISSYIKAKYNRVCPKIEWESKSIIIAICLLSMVGCTNSKSVKNQSYTDTTNVPTYQDIKNAESVQGIQNKL